MGPLAGIRVVELGGVGPVPFCGMMLADMGADVVRIDRVDHAPGERVDEPLLRSRINLSIDFTTPRGADLVRRLLAGADALIEGFRPGVAERHGLGPDDCLAVNPALVYGRMTGWGQEGPLAAAAGHDINFIALAGVLGLIGPAGGEPVIPLNLVGDFGGGGMLLAFGVVCGLLEARVSRRGQVVDAAMVDGAALLTTMIHGFRAQGLWEDRRGVNLLDGGAPFYGVYETSDGGFVALGAVEPKFWAELVDRIGMPELAPLQYDRDAWPTVRRRLAAAFGSAPLAEWQSQLEGTDACFAPVLSLDGAAQHPHNQARSTFTIVGGTSQPAPAPRFSRTGVGPPRPPGAAGSDTDRVLAELGLTPTEVAELRELGVVA